MIQTKYISSIFSDVYTKKYIQYNNHRLKTINLINIIDMFINRYTFFNKDNLKLNATTLKWLYGSHYQQYIHYLIYNDFIYLYKNYSSGLKSKTYKLTDKAKQIGYLSVNVDVPILLVNKTIQINTVYPNVNQAVKQKLIDDLYRVSVDQTKALNWIDNNLDRSEKSHFVNSACINKIHNKDLYYSFDNYGRFHTNFTVLKKQLRTEFIKLDDENIKEVDIQNSQPFFLYLLMKQTGFTKFDNFDQDVINGTIYDNIAQMISVERKQVKVNIYSVLFGRNKVKDYWNQLFEQLYPNVYQWIVDYKKQNKSYKSIARKLQMIESDFIFNKVIPKLTEYNPNMPMITVHDSIIVPQSQYKIVKTIFIECLNQLIFKPCII